MSDDHNLETIKSEPNAECGEVLQESLVSEEIIEEREQTPKPQKSTKRKVINLRL